VPAASFSDYLRLYRASWLKLQKRSPELSSYEDRMLYSTWQISFEHVKKQNELSAKLLQLWAYFDNQDLWLELLQHCDSESPVWMRELTEDEISFNDAISVLCNHGLVEASSSQQESFESRGYSTHACVHAWTISVLNQEWNDELAMIALECVASHVQGQEEAQWWVTQRRLLQHASRSSYYMEKDPVNREGIEWAYHRLGYLFADQGKLEEAEKMYERALRGYEKAWGPDHTSTLDTVNNLGNLYKNQGKLEEAEKMYERALRGKEKAWGPDHTSTLNTVNNLGNLYADQGKLEEAEKMYERALRGYEKALGSEQVVTYIPALNTVNNLGLLYKDQSKLEKAEKMLERALRGYEKTLGPNHSSTLKPVDSLLKVYYDRCFREIKMSTFGKSIFKPSTAISASPFVVIIKAVDLCIRYPPCRITGLVHLCAMFRWNNEDGFSTQAFRYSVSDTLPGYNSFCDGCGYDLNIGTGRNACTSCKDVDLCGSCFEKYEVDDLRDKMANCQDHVFLQLAKSGSMDDCTDGKDLSVEEWLQKVKVSLEVRKVG
jgi:tetratricopeptide (TPR) repeat protein